MHDWNFGWLPHKCMKNQNFSKRTEMQKNIWLKIEAATSDFCKHIALLQPSLICQVLWRALSKIMDRHLSHDVTKPTKWVCAEQRLRSAWASAQSDRPGWSESPLCVQWRAKDPRFLYADSEDSDQTGRMPRLIWVFAGRTLTSLVLSCRGSFVGACRLMSTSE